MFTIIAVNFVRKQLKRRVDNFSLRDLVSQTDKDNGFLSLLCHFENIIEQTADIDRASIGSYPVDRRNQRQKSRTRRTVIGGGCGAGCSIVTWVIMDTDVIVRITSVTSEALIAQTAELCQFINTLSIVTARTVTNTSVHIFGAVLS